MKSLDKLQSEMTKVELAVAKVKVIASSAVTWIMVIVSALTLLAQQVLPVFHGDWATRAGGWLARATAVLIGAVTLIHRVNPAPVGQRGILPPDPVAAVPEDPGSATVVDTTPS